VSLHIGVDGREWVMGRQTGIGRFRPEQRTDRILELLERIPAYG
jgi:hypothetical protein